MKMTMMTSVHMVVAVISASEAVAVHLEAVAAEAVMVTVAAPAHQQAAAEHAEINTV